MTRPATNPLLLDFPDFCETARLHIRRMRPGDGAAMFVALRESIDQMQPWMPWAEGYTHVDQAEEYVRRKHAEWLRRDNFAFSVIRRADDHFLGRISLHQIDWDVPRFEVGYWLRTSATGQGYMAETVTGVVDFARRHFGALRMDIWCDSLNVKSRAVAERAGFILELHQRSTFRTPEGALRDEFLLTRTWPEMPSETQEAMP